MGSPVITIGGAQSAVSGVYERRDLGRASRYSSAIPQVVVETIRLDVDGWYPQNMASGNFSGGYSLSGGFVGWAARIAETYAGLWEGSIGWKSGDQSLLPHSHVKIIAPKSVLGWSPAELIITFQGSAPPVTRSAHYASPYFRSAEIEWD